MPWINLARIDGSAFPDVLAVTQDSDSDAGALPCTAMVASDGGGCCAGNTINMSVDLTKVWHFNVHDALQGFGVWTEEMPKLHGASDDGTF